MSRGTDLKVEAIPEEDRIRELESLVARMDAELREKTDALYRLERMSCGLEKRALKRAVDILDGVWRRMRDAGVHHDQSSLWPHLAQEIRHQAEKEADEGTNHEH